MGELAGLETQVFRHPKSWWLGFAISFPLFGGAGVAFIVGPIVARSPFAVLLVPFGLWVMLAVFATFWLLPSRIVVSEELLNSRNYLGRSKRIRWDDISLIQEGSANAWHYEHLVRVTDGRQGGSIVFTDAISNFPGAKDRAQ